MTIFLIALLILFVLLKRPISKFDNLKEIRKKSVAIITLMYRPKNVETWLLIHRNLGIDHFFIRLEDTPELIDYLKSQPDVTLMVASSSKDTNQYTTLQTRQIETTNKVIKSCKFDFLIHIDCDEILDGDLDEIRNLPDNVGTFWMQNHEAVYSSIPTSRDSCFQAKFYRNCGDVGSGCASYVNGKGGGRISQSLESNGPHRFKSNLREKKINMIVKHYESCDFEQYLKKYSRLQQGAKIDEIPFPYYRESILAAGNMDNLKNIYAKYRTDN
jgi:hypothetical protein